MTTNFHHRGFLLLATSLPQSTRVFAASDPNSDFPSSTSNPSPYIGIVFLLFTAVIIFVTIIYYYLRERCLSRLHRLLLHLAAASANRVHQEELGGGGRGLNSAVVMVFPMLTYSDAKAKNVSAGTDCAVCLSEFQDDETLRLLPMYSHVFHLDCVGIWLAEHTTCPCCRADLLKESPSNDFVVDVGTPEGLQRD